MPTIVCMQKDFYNLWPGATGKHNVSSSLWHDQAWAWQHFHEYCCNPRKVVSTSGLQKQRQKSPLMNSQRYNWTLNLENWASEMTYICTYRLEKLRLNSRGSEPWWTKEGILTTHEQIRIFFLFSRWLSRNPNMHLLKEIYAILITSTSKTSTEFGWIPQAGKPPAPYA